MRWLAVVWVVLGCTAEQRPAPAPPSPDPRVAALEKRVDDLEAVLRAMRSTLAKLASAPPSPPPPFAPSPPPPPRFARLDRDKVYAVLVDDSPTMGNPNAAVTIVAAVQFPEPFTHKAWPTLVQLRGEYKQDLRLVIRYFVVHPKATTATIAACAAAYQGRIDEMEDAIWFTVQQPTATAPTGMGRELTDTELHDIASGLRLDLKQFERDDAGICKTNVPRDIDAFKKLGQAAVPVFWINGRPLEGAQPIEQFRTIIDEELAKAKADRAKGGKAATYYERITKTGATGP
jgi:protein-disulfide isomerase